MRGNIGSTPRVGNVGGAHQAGNAGSIAAPRASGHIATPHSYAGAVAGGANAAAHPGNAIKHSGGALANSGGAIRHNGSGAIRHNGGPTNSHTVNHSVVTSAGGAGSAARVTTGHHGGNHHLTNSNVAGGANAGAHHRGGNGNLANVGGTAGGSVVGSTGGRHHVGSQNWNQYHNNWNHHYHNHYHHNWYRGSSFAFRPWFYPYFGFGLGYGGWGYGGLGYGYGGYGGWGYGGYGFSPWGFNLLAYRWGYSPYYNPYCASYSYPYNYAQPVIINYSAAPTTVVEPAAATDLDAARTAFKAGDYTAALDAADRAIKATPDDPVAHELRALTLFALGRYDEAAAGLNALLAVAPGWNWETMLGMYPDVATYTTQLRALEAFVRENPNNPAANFVLGYHYLVTNFPDAARKKLQKVVELEPKDRVAAQLLKGLDDKAEPPATVADAAPSDAETDLSGAWTARQGDARLQLTLADDGTFTWVAPVGKEDRTITGKYTLAGNVLVLEAESGDAMVAKVTALGSDKFHFQFVGGPGDDPGLDFQRSATDVAKPPAAPEPPAPPTPPAAAEAGKEF